MFSLLLWQLQVRMQAMLKAWTHVSLRQAFNGWTAFVQLQQDKHDLQHKAVLFWTGREMAQVHPCSCGC